MCSINFGGNTQDNVLYVVLRTLQMVTRLQLKTFTLLFVFMVEITGVESSDILGRLSSEQMVMLQLWGNILWMSPVFLMLVARKII